MVCVFVLRNLQKLSPFDGVRDYLHSAEGGRRLPRTVGNFGCGRYGLVLKGRGGGVPDTW